MTPRKPPRQYAVYLGKDRVFPHNQKMVHGKVYEVEIIVPDKDYTFYRMYVHAPHWSIYIPYSSVQKVWADWMPYRGKEG